MRFCKYGSFPCPNIRLKKKVQNELHIRHPRVLVTAVQWSVATLSHFNHRGSSPRYRKTCLACECDRWSLSLFVLQNDFRLLSASGYGLFSQSPTEPSSENLPKLGPSLRPSSCSFSSTTGRFGAMFSKVLVRQFHFHLKIL